MHVAYSEECGAAIQADCSDSEKSPKIGVKMETGDCVDDLQPLALTRSQGQRPIGGREIVNAEIVFCNPGEELKSVAVIGEYDSGQAAIEHVFLLLPNWNDWTATALEQEGSSDLWSTVCKVSPGYHEFYFLLNGTRKVVSHRHARTPTAPGRPPHNWRLFSAPSALPSMTHSGNQGVLNAASTFVNSIWHGVGIIELLEDGLFSSKLQGSLSFPAAPSFNEPDRQEEEMEGDENRVILYARVPLAFILAGGVYFARVGASTMWRILKFAFL